MNEPHQYSEQDVEEALMRNAYAEGRKDEREEWLPVLEALKAVMAGCEFKNIAGDEDWHVIAMPKRAALDKARAAIQKAEGTT